MALVADGLVFEAAPPQRFRLRVESELPLGWSVYVAGNLAERGFDVEAATATRSSEGVWTGAFEGTRPAANSGAVTADGLLEPQQASLVIVPQVLEYAIDARDQVAPLEVFVRAVDEVGLLAAFLRTFGMLGLFPRSFDVATKRGEAHDRFWLAGIAGARVSDRSVRELDRTLARWQPYQPSRTDLPARAPTRRVPRDLPNR